MTVARHGDASHVQIMIGRNTLFVLNLALDGLNCVARFSIERDQATVVADGNEHNHRERGS